MKDYPGHGSGLLFDGTLWPQLHRIRAPRTTTPPLMEPADRKVKTVGTVVPGSSLELFAKYSDRGLIDGVKLIIVAGGLPAVQPTIGMVELAVQ